MSAAMFPFSAICRNCRFKLMLPSAFPFSTASLKLAFLRISLRMVSTEQFATDASSSYVQFRYASLLMSGISKVLRGLPIFAFGFSSSASTGWREAPRHASSQDFCDICRIWVGPICHR